MPGSDDENDIWNQIENIADTTSTSVEEQAEQRFDSETLKTAFDPLSAKEKFIIGHTYGLFGYEKLTVDDIALVEMMTPDGVRKAEKRAMERLKRYLRLDAFACPHFVNILTKCVYTQNYHIYY